MIMSTIENRAVKNYLQRLDRALSDLPADRRREIVAEIEAHIAAETARMTDEPSDAKVMDLLDRIGEPEAIAADARETTGVKPAAAPGRALEITALILLLVGGLLLPVIGWIVGVILLWASSAWTTRDKLIGTLIVPGGLALPFALGFLNTSASVCVSEGGRFRGSGGPSGPDGIVVDCATTSGGIPTWLYIASILLLALASIASTVYLARRMRSNPSAVEVAAIG